MTVAAKFTAMRQPNKSVNGNMTPTAGAKERQALEFGHRCRRRVIRPSLGVASTKPARCVEGRGNCVRLNHHEALFRITQLKQVVAAKSATPLILDPK